MTENQINREAALIAKETAIKNGIMERPVVYLKNCESKLLKEIQKANEATQRARARNVNKWVKKADRLKIESNDAEN